MQLQEDGTMSPKKVLRLLGTAALAGSLGVTALGTAHSSQPIAATQHVTTRITAAYPIVGMGATSNGQGYIIAAEDGGIFNFGNASFDGNTYTDGITGLGGSHPLNAPIVGMAMDPTGNGYWLVGKDGGVFNFGAAASYGSTYTYGLTGLGGSHPLNAPIVGMAADPQGGGYWLVAADGGVFNFGSAKFYGSTYTYGLTGLGGSHPLNAPIVGIIPTPNGGGYWLIAKDGGVFDFGDAAFYGSTYTYGLTGLGGSHPLNAPIVGGAAAPDGQGYWLVGRDGGVFDFGSAKFYGSTYTYGLTGLGGSHPLNAPIVGMAADPQGGGYWLVGSDGGVFNFGDAPFEGSVPGIPTPPSEQPASPPPTPTPTPASASSPALANPPTDLTANPYYYSICPSGPANNLTCLEDSIAAINNGRATQGLPPMVLPRNFMSLPQADQLFVLVNEERVSRGLQPAYGLVDSLNTLAAEGADANNDPPVSSATFGTGPWAILMNGNWAEDFSTASSMFDWMYNDGLEPNGTSTNLACTVSDTWGCWQHRANILIGDNPGYTIVMGAASVPESTLGGPSYFESDATVATYVPNSALSSLQFSYTWAQAVAAGANPQT